MGSLLKIIKKTGLADKVVLGGLRNHIPHIVKERPHMIALGYDQKAYVPDLKKNLKNKGKIDYPQMSGIRRWNL